MQCLSRAFPGIPPFSSPQVVLVGRHEEIAGCKCGKEIWLENGKSSSGQGIFKEGGREEEKEQKRKKKLQLGTDWRETKMDCTVEGNRKMALIKKKKKVWDRKTRRV